MSLYLGNTLIAGSSIQLGKPLNIGQIIQSALPLTDAGLHLLDGALINGSGIYSAFVTYIAGLVSTYPDLFTTEASWQTAVTNYGVCGKFVYDSVNNTVRLPKITGILEGTTDVTALGDLVQAGLPSLEHRHYNGVVDDASQIWVVANQWGHEGCANGGSNAYTGYTSGVVDVENSIYGNSNTVQPQTIKAFYYIVIATTTKTEIEVDIDQVATDLNGKADTDLSNCTKPYITESYKTTSGLSWYRVWSDGFIEQGSKCAAGNISYVSLLRPFTTTTYQVHSTGTLTDSTGQSGRNYVAYNKTTVGFNCFMGYSSGGAYVAFWDCANQWYACGY